MEQEAFAWLATTQHLSPQYGLLMKVTYTSFKYCYHQAGGMAPSARKLASQA